MQFEIKKFETLFFRYGMGLCAFAMFIAIGVYAYLGSFSRYLSDDYCEAVNTRPSIIGGVLERYTGGEWRAANRYSNLFFAGLSERLGKNNMPLTTAGMVILWPIGLSLALSEFRKFFKFNWSFQTDLFLGCTLGFFILLQAPNLFQSIYWRSSMMTHFAPLVFGCFLFAYWFRQAARTSYEKISPFVYLILFLGTFILAGFSEPPVATMVAGLGLIIAALWQWRPSSVKRIFPLLLSTFAGAFLGLMVMAFSPANANMVQDSVPSVIDILRDSFLFSYIFIVFSFKELPLPNLLSVFIPFLVIWSYKQANSGNLTNPKKRLVWIMIAASPILMWGLIAAGFSPSVYGQGYPIERMRFLARSIMTATLMFEGGLFGLLFQNMNFKTRPALSYWTISVLLILTGFVYPLRAALNIYHKNITEYQTRAEMWDLRNEYIIRHAQMGEQDIVVPGYSAAYSIKELDDATDHWVNLCAAKFYGVHTIRAVFVPEEYILEYLSE